MKIIPAKEIMKYVAFKNSEPIPKDGMPEEYKELFDDYKEKVLLAKELQKAELSKMGERIK